MKEKMPTAPENNQFESRRIGVARKALLEALIAFGIGGFFMGPEVKAQNPYNIPKLEQKEKEKPDFFRLNDLAKDYAKMAQSDPGPYNMKYREMERGLTEKYGRGGVRFMEKDVMLLNGELNSKPDSPNYRDASKKLTLEMETLFDDNLLKELSSQKESGYLVKQIELDGKKVDVLIKFAHAPLGKNGPLGEEHEAENITAAEISALDGEVSKDPQAVKKLSEETWQQQQESVHFELFIKGGDQHPGWYEVRALADEKLDPGHLYY